MMSAEQAVFSAILTCIAGAFVTLAVARRKTLAGWVAFLFVTASAGLVLDACVKVLLYGPSTPEAFLVLPRFGFVLRIHVDGLSTMFLLLAVLIAMPAALYSIPYMQQYQEYGVGRYYPHFLLFLAAMYGLLSTTDMMWFFLLFWQLMTLPGYALIRFERSRRENVRAATQYLLMMQLACTITLIGAQLLVVAAKSRGNGLRYDFDTVRESMPLLLATHPVLMALVFVCFLVGFGIKMGMLPFGRAWLPDAHPAAPSPVSAMLSGVMIKTGVYGLIRYFLWLVPMRAVHHFPMAYWGMIVAVLGTVTLFTGTMQALQQEQSKRLLAFHSIGQVGYILLGIGTCMALLPAGAATAPLAALGLLGAVLHVINHGVFKGLLFLNSGSMLYATGTQDLNRLGGLMKFMPLTAITALIASLSISGVPLFNGFISKWTIYVAAIRGSGVAHYLVVCAVVAILTSALTLASFVKFFGTSFLSRTSSLVMKSATEHRLEPGLLMQIPQLFLAALCVLLGIVPAIGFRLLSLALARSGLKGVEAIAGAAAAASSGPVRGVEMSSAGHFVPLALASILGLMFVAAFAISRLGRANRRTAVPWLCGYAKEADTNRYVAHNCYGEIKRYFSWLDGAKHGLGRQP